MTHDELLRLTCSTSGRPWDSSLGQDRDPTGWSSTEREREGAGEKVGRVTARAGRGQGVKGPEGGPRGQRDTQERSLSGKRGQESAGRQSLAEAGLTGTEGI